MEGNKEWLLTKWNINKDFWELWKNKISKRNNEGTRIFEKVMEEMEIFGEYTDLKWDKKGVRWGKYKKIQVVE